MSNLKGGLLKAGSGKTGRIIQSSWKGIDYIRIMPDHVRNPRTPDQQSQRGKFKSVTKLAKMIFHPIIRPIWNPLSKKHMGFNKFTQVNIYAFKDDGLIDNYKDLKFSLGELDFPEEMYVINDPIIKSRIIINCNYNNKTENSNENDILNIVALEENLTGFSLKILNKIYFTRKECQAIINLPFEGNSTIHIYPYFKSADGTSYSHNSYAKVKPIQ